MPTIDTSKIEGFEKMSDAEKIAALTGFEIPEAVDLSGYVKKSMFDSKCSELAAANKALKGKMTEDEAKQAEAAEKAKADQAERKKLAADLKEANQKLATMTYTNSYLAIGYDKKLAEEAAQAIVSGDMAKVFACQQKYNTAKEAEIKANLMNGDPRPGGGGGTDGKDPAVERAKELAKAVGGTNESIQKTLDYYS